MRLARNLSFNMGLSQGFCILVYALISARMCPVQAEEKVNNMMDKLVDRAFKAWPLSHVSLDGATIAKGNQPGAVNAEAKAQPVPAEAPPVLAEAKPVHTMKAQGLDMQSIIILITVAVMVLGFFLWKARQYIKRKTDLASFKESLLEQGATRTGGDTNKDVVPLALKAVIDDAVVEKTDAFQEFTPSEKGLGNQANSLAVKAFMDDLKAAEEDFGPPVPPASAPRMPPFPTVVSGGGTRIVGMPKPQLPALGSGMPTPQLPTSSVNPGQQPLYAPRGVVSKPMYSQQSAASIQSRSVVRGVSPQSPASRAPQAAVRQVRR